MKLTYAALTSLLLASDYALARPSTFPERSLRRGHPALPVEMTRKPSPTNLTADANPTTTSSNWAGVVLPSPPAGQNFTGVAGTFTVPSLANSSYTAACAWIGIDGWSTSQTQGLFQAGVDFWMENDKLTYDAWYEWVPDTSYNFTNFDISAGDVVTFRLVTSSDKAGTIYLENETTGQSTTKDLSAPPSPPFTDPVSALRSCMCCLISLMSFTATVPAER